MVLDMEGQQDEDYGDGGISDHALMDFDLDVWDKHVIEICGHDHQLGEHWVHFPGSYYSFCEI